MISNGTNRLLVQLDQDLYYNELMKRVAASPRRKRDPSVFADTGDTCSGV